MPGRTTFVIAHRISTVKQADLVIVLEHGRVTQLGTHEDLMREQGHYHEIAAAQLAVDDDNDERDRAREEREHLSHMDRVRDRKHVEQAAVGAQVEDHGEPFGK